jgi:DNA-binding NarL/FixJ family response regulator
VVVLADDLIWSTRISEAVRRAGGRPVPFGSNDELEVALEATALEDEQTIRGAIVDLAARRFDGVAAIARIAAARLPVIAVAEHDDQFTRKRALDAGARRVFSYRKFFEDGPRLVEGWLPTGEQRTTDG